VECRFAMEMRHPPPLLPFALQGCKRTNMPTLPRSPLARYGVVPVAVATALLLRLLLWPILQAELPFLFLWPALMFCAWYGGFGPGLLATLLSASAGAYFLLEPHHALALVKPADWVGTALFVLLGLFLSLLAERMHRAKRQVERHALELFEQRERFRVTLASIRLYQ
jgi:K+-sensing histidine kinase KdpD